MEQNLDVKLFFRNSRGVSLTEEGRLLYGEPARTEALHFKPVKTIEDVFTCTPSYLKNLEKRNPNALRKPLDYANIMLLNKYNISRRHIDEYLKDNDIFTDQISNGRMLEISSMDLLIEFAKVGLGIACVIKEFIETEIRDGSLVTIPLKNPIKQRNVGFVYLKERLYNDALDIFIDFFNNF